ncbi:MAG: hypothetical protein K2K88_06385 [Muribaculaceae bacterium]|nr:hypothetical protein [Muribaculaceae bacterium]MDE6352745.1 hypothetical protein [Muribaculaceae bacterium]MDE6643520.1 hypothetical protein [Muribaculaceae bacterium]MDE7091901.1 hypothetical protein [Muribaculaceae bacterium]
MESNLKYIDETDRCYGLAGSAIGLYIYDGESYIQMIDLDSDEKLKLSNEFYFVTNPKFSTRLMWNRLIKQFEMTMAMTLSDYLCRCHVNRHTTPTHDDRETLRLTVTAEGMEYCSLEKEEADAIFEKTYTYMNRVFNHSGVQSIARNFTEQLVSSRSLDHADIVELLDTLRML